MEHLDVALELMKPVCSMAAIDLKDAYYSVPIAPKFKEYLCFQWDDAVYKFHALPFGLTSAPRLFMKLMKPVHSLLHENKFLRFGFIDDSFLIWDECEDCEKSVKFILELQQRLGF